MTLNYIERMKYYNSLKQDYELQKIECSKKQERIIELSRVIRDLKNEIEELKEIIKNDRENAWREHNTRNKKHSGKTSKQKSKI